MSRKCVGIRQIFSTNKIFKIHARSKFAILKNSYFIFPCSIIPEKTSVNMRIYNGFFKLQRTYSSKRQLFNIQEF